MRVDDVQGKEYRALLISTVRTCTSVPNEAEDFLSNAKVQSCNEDTGTLCSLDL